MEIVHVVVCYISQRRALRVECQWGGIQRIIDVLISGWRVECRGLKSVRVQAYRPACDVQGVSGIWRIR